VYRFLQQELADAVGHAVVRGRSSGREICGLLVRTGRVTHLLPIRNAARRRGRFVLARRQVLRALDAAPTLEAEVVGTYHSHPFSHAVPGPGDLRGAVEGQAMLIIDCCERDVRLWRIAHGRARALRFAVLDVGRNPTVASWVCERRQRAAGRRPRALHDSAR